MLKIIIAVLLTSTAAFSQYEEYESYQTFSDIDKYQRDYGLVVIPSLMYSSVDESNEVTGASVNDRARDLFFYDFKIGYIFRGGFYFGLLYAGESVDINSNSPKTTRESLGASIGYIRHGWSLAATLFPYSKQDLDGTADVAKYSEGLGFQLDAGYFFRLSPYFSLGPQLTYKSIQYSDAESATTSVTADANSTHSVFTPMLTLMINLYRG